MDVKCYVTFFKPAALKNVASEDCSQKAHFPAQNQYQSLFSIELPKGKFKTQS